MKVLLNIILVSFIFIPSVLQGQNRLDGLKRQGLFLMSEGRYEEAVDQFNKYIAANPRLAEGYHLRGLCYEKRIQYQYSVLDLRRARRLDPANNEIKQDLDRVIAVWHRLLYQKIDGHTRDIAINPNNAFSYLEIGKTYRWLVEWNEAEKWYDQYLKRDENASPDEIIRYSEILAKTGSISKGERVLKKYTLRYPDDWRIWSRYGYFTLWLGKNNIAQDAFKMSLSFKPFFKEAADGLDMAKRQGYLTLYQGGDFESTEYPIDRYYRLLNHKPENDQTRFDLINELIKANRYEEAYHQLQYLSPKLQDDEKFKTQYALVTSYRDSTFNRDVNHFTEILKNNPSDKEAVLKLAAAYGNLYYYDSAIEVLSEYLQDIHEDQDLDARFKYSQYCSWNYEWEKAITQLDKLLELDPNNLDYQLLRGQIGVWTSAELDISEKYLLKVINSNPQNLHALVALGTLYSLKSNFQESKKFLDLALSLEPDNRITKAAFINYQIRLDDFEKNKTLDFMKSEARRLALASNYDKSYLKYKEYNNEGGILNRDESIEYAEVCTEAKKYNEAIIVYKKLLDQEFNSNLSFKLAQNYYLNEEAVNSRRILEELIRNDPQNDETRVLLADTYVISNQLLQAEDIYRNLLLSSKDEKTSNLLLMRLANLGDYYVKNKNYEKATSLYNEIQEETEDSELNKIVFLKQIDMSYALIQDKKVDSAAELLNLLNKKNKNEELKRELNYRRLFLGDVYAIEERYGAAEGIYRDILNESVDSADVRIVRERLSWLPPYGLSRGLSRVESLMKLFFPNNGTLAPFSSFYRDNQNFQQWNYGARFNARFIGFLSLGASWSRTNLKSSVMQRDFTQFKFLAGIYFLKYISLSGGYGNLNNYGEPDRRIGDILLKYELPDELSLLFSYENNDARMILYSGTLIPSRINANYYRFLGTYNSPNFVKASGYYTYFNLGDNNKGNDLQFSLGRKFLENGWFGYEYFFSDFAFISPFYYTPQNFVSHSLWTEWNLTYKKILFKVSGKIGFVPSVDFIVSEIFGEATYNPIANLYLSGRLSYGNSFRYDSSYKNYFASITAYWGIF